MGPESKARYSITAGDKAGPLAGWGRVLAKRIDPGLLVILALPWALLAAGANWIFGSGQHFNNIDPWVYFGYFLDLPAHLRTSPEAYYCIAAAACHRYCPAISCAEYFSLDCCIGVTAFARQGEGDGYMLNAWRAIESRVLSESRWFGTLRITPGGLAR